jgi:AraC family transcriptional regulator of adaptative response / DNA-3-methyladenine glycosylase II
LAKQLLHETDLTITQVAMASGFGSIRRFNESFQEVFKTAPSFLRREIGNEGPGVPAADIHLKLRYRAPYDWGAMTEFIKARLYPGVETFEAGLYRRSLCLDGRIGLVAVAQGNGDWLDVQVKLQDLTLLPKVIARVREAFDLAADPDVIGGHLRQDLALQGLVLRRPGLRVPGAFDPFEIGIRAILGQQITVSAAIKLGASLVSHLGAALPNEWAQGSGVSRLFPSAESILASSLDFLGMPQARVRCLKAYCEAYLVEVDFFGGDTSAVVARLLGVKGIGPWTASYIALRALRDPDAFPAEDVALARGLAQPGGERPTRDALEQRSQAWRPWRAYAAQHIWTELASG